MYDAFVFGSESFEHGDDVQRGHLATDDPFAPSFALLHERGQQLLTIGHLATSKSSCAFDIYVGYIEGLCAGSKVPCVPDNLPSRFAANWAALRVAAEVKRPQRLR